MVSGSSTDELLVAVLCQKMCSNLLAKASMKTAEKNNMLIGLQVCTSCLVNVEKKILYRWAEIGLTPNCHLHKKICDLTP